MGLILGMIIGFLAGILFNKNLYIDIKYNTDDEEE